MIINSDAIAGLKTLPDGSARCCITSPPYYQLRDYGIAGQIGLEQTPEKYINRLVTVFREVWRVLTDDGTLWVNIADTYAGGGKNAGNKKPHPKGYKGLEHLGDTVHSIVPSGCKPKDLIGIPWMLAFALRSDGWYLRQDIIWHKPNSMPESVKDRCTKAHEYIFLLSKSKRYYFDAEAIAEPVAESTVKRMAQDIEHQAGSDRVPGKTNGTMKAVAPRFRGKKYTENPDIFYRTKSGNAYDYKAKRNKRSVWTVSTKPFKEAHFATFPVDLIMPCILAGSRVGDTVIDPFFGSGTVGEAAIKANRDYVGIDINPDYTALAERRTGAAWPVQTKLAL